MKKKYKLLLQIFKQKSGGWLCNTIKNTPELHELKEDFDSRLSEIDKTDSDLWEQRPEYYKGLEERPAKSPKEMVNRNNPFWTEPNDKVREEFITRIISRL